MSLASTEQLAMRSESGHLEVGPSVDPVLIGSGMANLTGGGRVEVGEAADGAAVRQARELERENRRLRTLIEDQQQQIEILQQRVHELELDHAQQIQQALEEYTQTLQQVSAGDGSLIDRFWTTCGVGLALEELAVEPNLLPEAEQLLAELNDQLVQLRGKLAGQWSDPQVPAQLTTLHGKMHHTLVETDRLMDQLRHAWDPDAGELATVSFTQEVEHLAQRLSEIDNLTSALPELDPVQLPDWDRITQARRKIVHRHQLHLFGLRSAVVVAKADGRLAGTETEYLMDLAEQYRLTFNETKDLILKTTRVATDQFSGDQADAKSVLQIAAGCALADGVVDDSELDVLRVLAMQLDLPEDAVPAMLEELSNPEKSEKTG